MTFHAIDTVNILTYHSIAHGRGPLAIAPGIFRAQMDTLADRGFHGISLRDYFESRADRHRQARNIVVLTFDDGYADFADVVAPEIASRGWTATVFLPSGLLGAASGWDPDGAGARPLLDWRLASDVAQRGMELGAHSVTHPDLTRLCDPDLQREIADSKDAIEQRTGHPVTSFAAPYGRTTLDIRRRIARLYQSAVGTTMAPATLQSDPYDLPRIDMWYFRDSRRWRSYLEGSTGYFKLRRALREARIAVGMGVGPR
jgi:peptidoglycan/xylan/chitin deacetylase (PgdA/CDA1 family)